VKRLVAAGLSGLLLLLIVAGAGVGHPLQTPAIQPEATVEDVAISTEYAFEFLPPQVTVTAGDTIDLVVTQADDIPHTFTLSSVVNYTIPNTYTTSQLYAFFNAHPPLVNLSLPPTVGAEAFANFTAPPVGTYEFVCEIQGHFEEGMYGFLTTSNQGHTSTGSSSTSFPLSTLEIGVIVVVAAVIVVGVALTWRRSRKKAPESPSPGAGPPQSPSP